MKQMDTLLFQHGQSIDEIKNRLNCIENGVGDFSPSNDRTPISTDSIKPGLVSDPEFINGIVDNIMTNSNLAEIIEQMEVVQDENRELRELLYAQQKTINEMNIMLLKLFSQSQGIHSMQPVKPVQPVQPMQPVQPVAAQDAQDVQDAQDAQEAEDAQEEAHDVQEDVQEEAHDVQEEEENENIALEIVDK
jgi:hypothetical protein